MKTIGRRLLVPLALVLLALAGCSGDDGDDGAPGESSVIGILPASSASSLKINIDSVAINSAPVVSFTATDGNGIPVAGLSLDNVRFTIATLMPGTFGDPSEWVSYIENSSGQATAERDGVLEDQGNGKYSYTFNKDITADAVYSASRTHRVAMQIGGFPAVNPTLDFRPDGGAVSVKRDIVETASCNSCHNKLALHGGGRIEMKYCVTCHTPQTIDPDTGNTVDFKVMIHKIHMGEDLPSVAFGPDLIDDTADDGTGVYQIIGFRGSVHDYSTVVYPQDIRNCSKCHTQSDATPQGDSWKTNLSIQACGSCHDNIDFSKDGSASGANDPLGHSGGIVTDNSECTTCHASGRIAGSIAERHVNPVKAAEGKFQFNILKICGATIATDDPDCPLNPGVITVEFSVSDPTGATTHGHGNLYDVAGPTNADRDPEFGASASLNLLTAWDSSDYTNDGPSGDPGLGSRPARAKSLSALTNATYSGADGIYTIDLAALPVGLTSGSGAVAIEGHPRAETVVGSGSFNISVPVRGAVAYFGINGSPPVERRVAVDVATKCDECHGTLSLHGNNRADNAQLCVMCHNPRNTDISVRPGGMGIDGKLEESIDMKRLIHALHAGEASEHGFREKGIVVYGFRGSVHDYSHVRFPGILSDCTTCHNDGTYELEGKWEMPLQSGILASSVQTNNVDIQTDDLFTTPTAAVCSACHDGGTAKAHMEALGGAKFAVDQAGIDSSYETCSVCHGPGDIADLNVVHGLE